MHLDCALGPGSERKQLALNPAACRASQKITVSGIEAAELRPENVWPRDAGSTDASA